MTGDQTDYLDKLLDHYVQVVRVRDEIGDGPLSGIADRLYTDARALIHGAVDRMILDNQVNEEPQAMGEKRRRWMI